MGLTQAQERFCSFITPKVQNPQYSRGTKKQKMNVDYMQYTSIIKQYMSYI